MEDIFDYNFFDTKNKKRLTKDLENLPSKELIKMSNVLIKSQNKTFKILYKNETDIKIYKKKIKILEGINNKYEKYFDEFEDLFDVKKD